MKLIRKSYYFNNSRLILPSKDENTITQSTYFFFICNDYYNEKFLHTCSIIFMTDFNPVFRAQVALWVRYLDYLTTHTSILPIQRGFASGFVKYKKGALDSQPQVIKFISCLPMVGGSLRVLLLLPPLKLVAMI
jgi:hypothetical protein